MARTPAPSCSTQAVYGLTELHREQIAGAQIVANPGCYPTAAVLALAPLARAGLIADVVIDAKQGISGAGRTFDDTTHLSMAGENILPYKVAAHRHTPEIEEQLSLLGAEHAGPVPGPPRAARPGRARQLLRDAPPAPSRRRSSRSSTRDAYAREPFVEVVERPPGTRDVHETNFCRVLRRRRPAHRQGASCSRRSTTSGRAPPRRRCRT